MIYIRIYSRSNNPLYEITEYDFYLEVIKIYKDFPQNPKKLPQAFCNWPLSFDGNSKQNKSFSNSGY